MLNYPHLNDIITSWSIPQFHEILVNSWTVNISASNVNIDCEKFYVKLHRDGLILVHSTSRKYKELEEKLFQAFEIENTNQEKVNQQQIDSAVARLENLQNFIKISLI